MNLTKLILVILGCLFLRASIVAHQPHPAQPAIHSRGEASRKMTAGNLECSSAGVSRAVVQAVIPCLLDTSFGAGGLVTLDLGNASDLHNSVVVQPDGRIVVASSIFNFNPPVSDFTLARFNSDGALDVSFGAGGIVTTDFGSDDLAAALLLQPDGKIVAAGYTNADSQNRGIALARYNTDGSLDAGFGVNGKVVTDFGESETVVAVALQADGKIVVAGDINSLTTSLRFLVVRYNANGSLDAGFGSGGKADTVFPGTGVARSTAVAIQSDGKIVAAGLSDFLADFHATLARYNTDGSLDASFGAGGVTLLPDPASGSFSIAEGLAIQPDGKIVIAGTYNIFTFLVARFNADGSLDSGFGANGLAIPQFAGEARAVALQPGGKIVAVGNVGPVFGVAQFNPNGAPDPDFGVNGRITTDFGGETIATGVAIQPDGKIVAVGERSQGGRSLVLARYGCSQCTFSINPASQNFTSAGGTGSVSVTAVGECAWTATSNDGFITITSGASGAGNGTVNFTVAENTGAARSGTLTVAGQTFTVTQDAGSMVISAPVPAGLNVTVQLGGVTIIFSRVHAPGIATFTPGDPCIFLPGDPCQDLPLGFSNFGNRAFDIQTTATVAGPITLSFDLNILYPPDPVFPVDPITPALVSSLRVFHVENGVLIDRTTPTDPIIPVDPIRIAIVDSLSHFVIARQPPRAALQSALADLRAVRQTITNRNDVLRLNVAIQSLTLALNPHLWRDPTHLQPLTGVVVYAALKGAIVPLRAALNDPRSSIPAATSRFYIDRILDSGRRLALIAINDASAAGGSQEAIDRANQEISEGDAAVADSKFEDAIVNYALAWVNARLALRGA